MRRRDFIAGLGSAAAWPAVAQAQQPAMPVIGFVSALSPEASVRYVASFRAGLDELGFVEGKNVVVDYHWLQGQSDRVPATMAELVRRRVAVIATPDGGAAMAQAAKAATATIPIVFGVGDDPVRLGLVTSLARPGGNVTGIFLAFPELAAKWLELLKEIAPRTANVQLLFHPAGPPLQFFMPSIQAAALSFNVQVSTATVHAKDEIEGVIAAQARDQVGGLIVMPNAFNTTNRELIIALAARYGVPAIYFSAYCAQSGGLHI